MEMRIGDGNEDGEVVGIEWTRCEGAVFDRRDGPRDVVDEMGGDDGDVRGGWVAGRG